MSATKKTGTETVAGEAVVVTVSVGSSVGGVVASVGSEVSDAGVDAGSSALVLLVGSSSPAPREDECGDRCGDGEGEGVTLHGSILSVVDGQRTVMVRVSLNSVGRSEVWPTSRTDASKT